MNDAKSCDENIIGSCEDIILKCLSAHDDHDENISNNEACSICLLETFMSIVWHYYLWYGNESQ